MAKQNQKPGSFYLIEQYRKRTQVPEYTCQPGTQPPAKISTEYDVRNFRTEKELRAALLKGPQHKRGKLTATRKIEYKLEVRVD